MIKTVIFDIGNVLVDFKWMPTLEKLIPDDRIRAKVHNAMWISGLWNEFDRGVLTDEEILKAMTEVEPEVGKEIRYVYEQAGLTLGPREYAKDWIRECKESGLQVLFLSNYSVHMQTLRPDVLDFLPLMDGGVFSCDVKLIKPDRAIFEKICELYDLTPSECVFIDDHQPNIDAAGAFGLNTIHFENIEQVKAELKALR